MEAIAPTAWDGRVNCLLPEQPTPDYPSAALFRDATQRNRYWLPDPPGVAFRSMQQFWERMSVGITAYHSLQVTAGPIIQSLPPGGDTGGTTPALGLASRESRSPNWSGAMVAAGGGNTLTQVVGSWVEPAFEKAGSYSQSDEFRSSIWIGFNGHAAYLDASLPQIGTLQRIVFDPLSNAWISSRWVWFEWWAKVKGKEAQQYVKPVYMQLDVQEGDTVWCRIDLIPSGVASYPHVARMCLRLDRPASGSTPASQVLVMPFIVNPPKSGNRWSRISGSTANWITELPLNIDGGAPFLLPRFGPTTGTNNRVNFSQCVAGSASDPGEPLIAEHTLEISKRFHMYNCEPRGRPSLAKIATSLTPRTSDTQFSIQVDGNDA